MISVLEASRLALAELRDLIHCDDLVLQVEDETLPDWAKVTIVGFPLDPMVYDSTAVVMISAEDLCLVMSNIDLGRVIFERIKHDRRSKGWRG